MSAARQKRRANRAAAESRNRHSSGVTRVPTPSPPVGPPPSFARAILSGRALWVSLALIATIVIVYAPVRQYGFVSLDDPQYVSENRNVLGGLTWPGVTWAFTTVHASYWIPLTWLSYMLDVEMYGSGGGGFHITNVLLHIVNVILLFGLLHRITGALGRSAFVAALFAVHPLHVESVTWVTERKDVLSTLFWMLALWGYVWYVRRPSWGRYLAAALFFVLGLMAKPMVVTLPFVFLLLDVWPLRRISLGADSPGSSVRDALQAQRSALLRLVREKLPLFAITVAWSIGTFLSQRELAVSGLETFPLSLRVENALVSYAAYIGKMLWPARLAVFYPFPRSIPGWRVAVAVLVLIIVSVVVLRAARRQPYLPVGWLWYLGTLVPVIGLVKAGDQAMADRFTYVPLLGIYILAAWGIPDLLGRWRFDFAHQRYWSAALAIAAGLVIAACMMTARAQVRYWEGEIALWQHTLEVTTNNYVAHTTLGIALWEQGKASEAITQYSEAIRIRPDYAVAHNDLGIALANQGKVDDAVREFLEALRIKPEDADFNYNAAVLLAQQGKSEEAARYFETVLKLNPRHSEARRRLDNLTNRGRKPAPGTP